jgi:beta-glucosidase
VDVDGHHALARRAAAAGSVLLTNNGVLPLADTRGVALIGAFAVEPRYQGAGSSLVSPTRLDTLRDALGPDLPFALGYDPESGEAAPEQIAQAVAVAAVASCVVLVVGIPPRQDSETRDRPNARLPRTMDDLVTGICTANPRTVVVLMNGGSLELDWAAQPAAILEAYLGGQAGGSALADVLLGRAEPTGRLAESIPFAVSDLPSDDNFPGLPRQVQYREGQWIGYRFHDTFGVPARFAFGHGLGYTTFNLDDLRVDGDGTARTATVSVTNTGARRGATVIQVYLRAVAPGVPRPAKELAGFVRVELDAGISARVEIALEPRVFAVWDRAAGSWVVEGGAYEVLVGTSSVDIRGRAAIAIDTADRATPLAATAVPVATDAEFAVRLGRPIPRIERTRPFRRTSTITEVSESRLGAILAWAIRRRMKALVPAGEAGTTQDIVDGVIVGLPLRALATMGKGISTKTLDRLIAVLNWRFIRAIRGR